jgi:hypothetical protein
MSINKKDVAAILIFVALILAFVLLVNNITNKNSGRELQIVRDAVKNAALTCYAVEGAYPEDISYLRENYRLAYDESQQLYFTAIMQKQGYYSYQFVRRDGSVPPSEGSFFQTENNYQALVYYKGTGERTWQLVGYRTIALR